MVVVSGSVFVGYGWCLYGSWLGVVLALPLAMVLLLRGEHADYWLVWPGVALMIGAVLGCWLGLRYFGYTESGATGLVYAAVLAVLYWFTVFVIGDRGMAMTAVLVIPLFSPLLAPLARAIVLVLADLVHATNPSAGSGGD